MKKSFKRSRGRPKKIKKLLKKIKKTNSKLKGKRGRPKGKSSKSYAKSYKSYKNMHSEPVDENYVLPKSYKFLGYCPRGCDAMINKSDLVSKRIYVCWKCGKRQSISKLKQVTSLSKDAPKTKKEFLQTTNVVVKNENEDFL